MTVALERPARPLAPARPVTVRPAPRREPLFDDELPADLRLARRDPPLPFELPALPALWRPAALHPLGLPDPAPWGRRLLIGLAEAAAGRRPLTQVAALLSPSIARGLGADLERAAATGSAHWLRRAVTRTVRASEPTPGVAELSATVEVGPRVRAVAMRLEAQHGHWRCVRLQLG